MKAVLSPLSTHTDIVNPSPAMTDEGMPIYYNTASFYAQEIPDCDPNDETCEPIKHEKTDLEAVIEGDFTSKPSIDPGIIEGEINRYSSVDFQKLGRTSDDSDESAIPLAGAVFTVYKANEDGTRGDIAIAKDGTKLENLVTNDEGKLCQPEALAIQKTETGVLFEVLSCGFGPFELMWLTDASGVSGKTSLEEKQAMAQTVSSMMDPKINLAAVMQQLKKRLLVAEIKQEVPFPKRAIR